VLEPLKIDDKIVGVGYPAFRVTSEPLIAAAKKKLEKLNNTGDDTIYE
jgi:hypothetical protein